MSEQVEPPARDDIDSRAAALQALRAHNGATILSAAYAKAIARQFGVDFDERPGELEPISNLDRLQPDPDDLGIGVGSLCESICKRLDDVDAEAPTAAGHGRTQRLRKDANVDSLAALAG